MDYNLIHRACVIGVFSLWIVCLLKDALNALCMWCFPARPQFADKALWLLVYISNCVMGTDQKYMGQKCVSLTCLLSLWYGEEHNLREPQSRATDWEVPAEVIWVLYKVSPRSAPTRVILGHGQRPQGRARTCWSGHISQLVWEDLRMPKGRTGNCGFDQP